jgi:maleylpyruvate isomerase
VPARSDNVVDPAVADSLLLARRGTAFFSRKLNELTDDEYTGPSLLVGWTRNHLIAHVGYNARAITRLVEWAHTGVETPMYESTAARDEEIEYGATLNPIALRNLHHHAVVALNVEWRDLPADKWDARVRTVMGREVPVSETIWMRIREVWLHAIDLDNGATFEDLPPHLLDLLLDDVLKNWARRGVHQDLVLTATDRPRDEDAAPPAADLTVVEAPIAQLVAWATGRQREIGTTDGRLITADRWL